MKNVVITGATGPLGAALLQYLAAQGSAVTVLVNPGSRRKAAIPDSPLIQRVECDLTELPSLAGRLPGGQDAFFHLGWSTYSGKTAEDALLQVRNIDATLEAVKLAASLGCRVFVGAGSQAEYGRVEENLRPDTPIHPETGYGVAKYAAGHLSRLLCEDLGLRHCWCRILSVYGPFDRETTAVMYIIGSLLKKAKPSLSAGDQIWDYLYSSDCALALALIAEKGRHGVSYPVGSGIGRPLREFFEEIRDLIDPSLPLGLGEKPSSPRGLAHLCADISALREDTGFTPQISFREGIEKTISWARGGGFR